MIVYGDPAFTEPAAGFLRRLRGRALGVSAQPSLDALRSLLIEAGQFEQAVADASADDVWRVALSHVRTVTDAAATAFLAPGDPADLRPFVAAIDGIDADALPARLRVTIPEGFAFYSLYPEQYAEAARRWLADTREVAPGVLVVGVRSIGTALSAVVAATLNAAGCPAHRVTVRPTGHPFSRAATLPPGVANATAWGLVVDEGPGMSGSSMAATAGALVVAGIRPDRVVFFPGHGGGPGHAASPSVRTWWDAAPRRVVSRDNLRWNGRALPDALAAATPKVLGREDERVIGLNDLGGGLWRGVVFHDSHDWPPANVPFERPKYRVVLENGAAVLWSYAGLAAGPGGPQAEAAAARQNRLAAGGWTPPALGTSLGFVATPWVDGTPLTRDDADSTVLAHVGRYIVEAAKPPLPSDEGAVAVERLREMLYWNTWETLGEEAAARTRALWDGVQIPSDLPAYGDGRLAPHEWLRETSTGRLWKADAWGHDSDHTVIGSQCVLWDIAGAFVEWGLDGRLDTASGTLLAAVEDGLGRCLPPVSLRFNVAAYAAFRTGQTMLCADALGHDPDDQARLWAAASAYKETLARALGSTA